MVFILRSQDISEELKMFYLLIWVWFHGFRHTHKKNSSSHALKISACNILHKISILQSKKINTCPLPKTLVLKILSVHQYFPETLFFTK